MAIIKHQTSKNARYSDVLDYYTYQHEESQKTGHYEPKLDENGLKKERENYSVAYINAHGQEGDPELWAAACVSTNRQYRKNMAEGDRKSHEYIISFPAEDREHMSMKDLMDAGKKCVRENFPGYDCLIAVHRDTDNDHIHISMNSVRALQREEQPWMMKKNGQTIASEMAAGGKHQDSPQLRRHLNDWLLEYSRQNGLTREDNNAKADANRAARHGSKNEQMKTALLEAAGRSRDLGELQRIMKAEYNMDMKATSSGKTISVRYPGNEKYVRLRTLGVDPAEIFRRMQGEQYKFTPEVAQAQEQKKRGGKGTKAIYAPMNWRLQGQLDKLQGTNYAAQDKARYFEKKRQQGQEPARGQVRKRTKGPEGR